MEEDIVIQKFKLFIKNEIPDDSFVDIIAGAQYFEHFGGTELTEYWKTSNFDNRDEMFVILNTFLSLTSLIKKIPHKAEKRLEFDVAFLFQLKSVAQTFFSIDTLNQRNCYSDCYSLIRTLLSKLNLLILFSINPKLFDKWLKEPKNEIFLDGKVRQELNNSGIYTAPYLYELTSEIIHGQYEALNDIGYLSGQGLFNEIKPIRNQVYVLSKFILGFKIKIMLTMLRIDFGTSYNKDLNNFENLYEWFLKSYLNPSRIDQLFTFIAEDRHWEKVGKDTFSGGRPFNYNEFAEQLQKFHKSSQPKKLSKKYT